MSATDTLTETPPGNKRLGRGGARTEPPEHVNGTPVVPETFEDLDPGDVNIDEAYRGGRYRASQLTVQLARYVKIRGDLAVGWKTVSGAGKTDERLVRSAMVSARMLASAKKQLESPKPDLPIVANSLGLADRWLVPLYSRSFLQLRLHTVLGELRRVEPRPVQDIDAVQVAAEKLVNGRSTSQTNALSSASSSGDKENVELAQTVLKDALARIHGDEEQRLLEDDLQVSRLNYVIALVLFSWLLFMVIVPVVSSPQVTEAGALIWPVVLVDAGPEAWRQALSLLLAALGLSIVGAVGGVISGMITVRDSRSTLMDYRTSIRKLVLRPLVGAVAALTLYLFLWANVVNGVEVTDGGVYVVAAFLAGFSERYFLRIISQEVDTDHDGAGRDQTRPASRPAS